jgi:site-specific recombinase XerD
MNVSKAVEIWLDYHKAHSKKNTVRAYESILFKFCREFDKRRLNELSNNDGILLKRKR